LEDDGDGIQMKRLAIILLAMSCLRAVALPSNGLSPTPGMMIGTWYQYGGTVTETQFKALVVAAANDGLLQLGYNTIVLEDPKTTRTGTTLHLNSSYFADDFPVIAAFVHSYGFKFGVYESPSTTTCGGNPGSYGFETNDATTFAAAGADYLEYDWCGAGTQYGNTDAGATSAFTIMGSALQATGRPIYYMIFAYGLYGSPAWYISAGANAVRVAWDIEPQWANGAIPCAASSCGIYNIGFFSSWAPVYSGPGHFQFGDQLMIGCGTCTTNPGTISQAAGESQMNLWSILASPLMIGSDLVNANSATLAVLSNSEVIAVDQDRLGIQGTMVSQVACGSTYCEVWAKRMSYGWAVGLFNLDSSAAHNITATWSSFGGQSSYYVRDLWAHSDLGLTPTGYTAASVPADGSAMLLLTYPRTGVQKADIQRMTVQ
jgi:alpha-galactosidase